MYQVNIVPQFFILPGPSVVAEQQLGRIDDTPSFTVPPSPEVIIHFHEDEPGNEITSGCLGAALESHYSSAEGQYVISQSEITMAETVTSVNDSAVLDTPHGNVAPSTSQGKGVSNSSVGHKRKRSTQNSDSTTGDSKEQICLLLKQKLKNHCRDLLPLWNNFFS